jgi:essential nuclear protein 1
LHPHNATERRTLADIIFAKLESGETENNAAVIKKVQQGKTNSSPPLKNLRVVYR